MDLIVQAETKKLKGDSDIIKLKDEKQFLNTYTFLQNNFNNENFDINKYRNDKSRTLTEIKIDQFTKILHLMVVIQIILLLKEI